MYGINSVPPASAKSSFSISFLKTNAQDAVPV